MTSATVLPKATHVSELTADDWARKINGAWGKCAYAVFELGELLRDAKGTLPHGQFERMVSSKLPFSMRTAQRLMAISRCEYLREHRDRLPPCWGTLNTLTKLAQPAFYEALQAGKINTDMTRRDAERLVRRKSADAKATSVERSDAVVTAYGPSSPVKPAQLVQMLQALVDVAESTDLPKLTKRCSSERRDALLERIAKVDGWLQKLEKFLKDSDRHA